MCWVSVCVCVWSAKSPRKDCENKPYNAIDAAVRRASNACVVYTTICIDIKRVCMRSGRRQFGRQQVDTRCSNTRILYARQIISRIQTKYELTRLAIFFCVFLQINIISRDNLVVSLERKSHITLSQQANIYNLLYLNCLT